MSRPPNVDVSQQDVRPLHPREHAVHDVEDRPPRPIVVQRVDVERGDHAAVLGHVVRARGRRAGRVDPAVERRDEDRRGEHRDRLLESVEAHPSSIDLAAGEPCSGFSTY